jgi:hypothetical protein
MVYYYTLYVVYYLYPIHGILFIPYTWYIIYTLYMIYYLYPIHGILFIPYTWYIIYTLYIVYYLYPIHGINLIYGIYSIPGIYPVHGIYLFLLHCRMHYFCVELKNRIILHLLMVTMGRIKENIIGSTF